MDNELDRKNYCASKGIGRISSARLVEFCTVFNRLLDKLNKKMGMKIKNGILEEENM